MRLRSLNYALFIVSLAIGYNLYAQDENSLKIFGYWQGTYQFNDGGKVTRPAMGSENSSTSTTPKSSSFMTQQLNLFLAKDFAVETGELSTFVNFEFVNNFNSSKKWGNFSLEEAWLKYTYSDALSIKAGMLIPTFNNMNTIKNKTPLLPYIMRPIIYEASSAELVPLSAFVPDKASIEVSGFVPLTALPLVSDFNFDYALYVGNSESSYIATTATTNYARGLDSSMFKMVGGRIGFRSQNIKFGVSGTYDRENLGEIFDSTKAGSNVVRWRLGADLSINYGDFFFEGEFIKVLYDRTSAQKEVMSSLQNMFPGGGDPGSNPGLPPDSLGGPGNGNNGNGGKMPMPSSLDKYCYYLTLGYQPFKNFTTYISYTYVKDDYHMVLRDGMKSYSFGINYQLNNSVVLKSQYIHNKLGSKFDYNTNYYNAAISVNF